MTYIKKYSTAEPGFKPNLYFVSGGASIKSQSPIQLIQVLLNGKVRSELDLRRRPQGELTFSHSKLYEGISKRHRDKAHIMTLVIFSVNGEYTIIKDYLEMASQMPISDFMRFRHPIRSFESGRLGKDEGYKMSAIIPPDATHVTIYYNKAVNGVKFSKGWGQSIVFGYPEGQNTVIELYRGEQIVGLFVYSTEKVEGIQLITDMRRTHLYGSTVGSIHELVPPKGHGAVAIQGYIQAGIRSIGLVYVPHHHGHRRV